MKILFIHVPAALMAINAWLMMLVASLVWFIRRHHVSALAARAAAPVGATMTLIALLTGAIWGEPMWGTWWAWDPRLTSFFVLFLFYLGYMALWEAVDEPDKAADLTAIVCLVGSVFALLSRYAVFFWSQGLHQGPSLSLDARENVDDAFWWPLVISMAGFVLLFVSLVLVRTRTEIRARRLRALRGAGGAGLMPDLARYAGTVLGAYAVTLALLALIVALSWGRSVRVRRRLAEVEARMGRRGDGQAGA